MMNFFKRKKQAGSEVSADEKTQESAYHLSDSEPNSDKHNYEAWSPDTEISSSAEQLVMETPTVSDDELELIANAGGFKEQVTAALKKVYDPEIPVDIYELGLVYEVDISQEQDVSIQMTLTSPGCPVAGQMPGMVEHALKTFVPDIGNVNVDIVWEPQWTPERMSEAAQLELGFI